jgi:hypothetical protein
MVLWSVCCPFAFSGKKSFLSFFAPAGNQKKCAGEWGGPHILIFLAMKEIPYPLEAQVQAAIL